jgi:TP901 family phage tail tape measure protein
MEAKFKSAGSKLANLQTGLAAVGAGAFLKGAIDESTAFQKSLNMTEAVTGSTAQQMDMLRQKALEWGSQTQFSSTQVAGAMAELGKMGNKTNEIISLMPGTMALAAAGEISMAEAANFSMGILNQFGMALDQSTRVADILAKGASGAATSVSGLAAAMNNTGLQASMAGLSIEDTTAALMSMASKNMEGAEAGTMMMNALKQLQVMPDKVRKGFEGMGIDIDNFRDATTGQMTDFFGLIGAMKDAGATGAQLGKMFDVRSMKAMAILVETNTADLMGYRDQVTNSTGASKEMADTLKKGLTPMIEFQSIMQNLKVIVGTFVTEAINPLLGRFNKLMGFLQTSAPWVLKLGTYFLMAVTAIGAIIIPLGLFMSAISSIIAGVKMVIGLTKVWTAVTKIGAVIQAAFNAVMALNPVALIVLGIVALIAAGVALYKNWDVVSAFMIKIWDKIKMAGAAVWEGLKTAFTLYINFVKAVFYTFADYILTTYGNIFKIIIGLASKVGGAFGLDTSKLDGMITKMSDLQESIRDKSLVGGSSMLSPYLSKSEEAPIPGSGRGANANASASVSVYTEKGMGVVPFKATGDLGYQMENNYIQ